MMTVLLIINVFLVVGWSFLHLGMNRWAKGWTLDPEHPMPVLQQTVRVIIPTRNESMNIVDCLRALERSENVELDVVVVDDGSHDDTYDLAFTYKQRMPNLTVITGRARPSNWTGKAWACQQGSEGVNAEWVCFLDADVRLHARTLAIALELAKKEGLGLLSLFGTWELVSFWERVLVPAMGWFIRGSISLDKVNRGQSAFANGQFLLFKRDVYLNIGRHQSVQNSVLDDVGLAHVVLTANESLGLRYAPWAFKVRLYRSYEEISMGYRKNLYDGMERNPFVAILAIGFLNVFSVLPVLLFFVSLFQSDWLLSGSSLVVWTMIWVYRLRLEKKSGGRGAWWIALLHPLAGFLTSWIIFRSMISTTVSWKGRSFSEGMINNNP